MVHDRLTMAACVADGGVAVDAGADAGGGQASLAGFAVGH